MDKPEKFGHLHLVYHFIVPLNVAFRKNWTTMEKGCPLHFEIYDKEKLRSFSETSFNSPLNQIFGFFYYFTKRLMGFFYLLYLIALFCFFISFFLQFWGFSQIFFFKHPIVIYLGSIEWQWGYLTTVK